MPVALVALALVGSAAGRPSPVAAQEPQFSARARHVEVYATVSDSRGALVKGLGRDDFLIEEDGQPQEITAFSQGEMPLAIAIGIDHSFSVSRDRLGRATGAARRFIDHLRPEDRVMVVAFGSQTEVLAPLSTNRAEAVAALARLEPWGTTPLFDAALAGIDAIQSASGRRALVLLSDGRDRYSRATAGEVLARARKSDVLIYPVAVDGGRPPVFSELAAVTGGRSFAGGDTKALDRALSAVVEELRFQYLLGYTPSRPETGGGEWRSIRVSVKQPTLRVRARDGYFP